MILTVLPNQKKTAECSSKDKHSYLTVMCECCHSTFKVPVPCGDRFCEVCNARRQRIARSKMKSVLNSQVKIPGYVYRHITLSVSNCENLADGVKFLIESFRRLRQRAYWKQKVRAGVFTVEVTGRPKSWHPHLHIIVHTKGISWDRLSKDWNHCSGGLSCYIQSTSPYVAVKYLTKYITKSSVSPGLRSHVSSGLKGCRLFQFFGSWHGESNKIKPDKYSCSDCGKQSFVVLDFICDMRPRPHPRTYLPPYPFGS